MERRGKRRRQLLDDIKDTGNGKRKNRIAICGELSLEKAIDCRKTHCGMNVHSLIHSFIRLLLVYWSYSTRKLIYFSTVPVDKIRYGAE